VTVHDNARSERRARDASSRMPSSVIDVICIETHWEGGDIINSPLIAMQMRRTKCSRNGTDVVLAVHCTATTRSDVVTNVRGGYDFSRRASSAHRSSSETPRTRNATSA
jgi:hypothetical protein